MSTQRLRDAAAHVRLTTDQYPPGVGLALADWLEDEALRDSYLPASARVAELILGDAS